MMNAACVAVSFVLSSTRGQRCTSRATFYVTGLSGLEAQM